MTLICILLEGQGELRTIVAVRKWPGDRKGQDSETARGGGLGIDRTVQKGRSSSLTETIIRDVRLLLMNIDISYTIPKNKHLSIWLYLHAAHRLEFGWSCTRHIARNMTEALFNTGFEILAIVTHDSEKIKSSLVGEKQTLTIFEFSNKTLRLGSESETMFQSEQWNKKKKNTAPTFWNLACKISHLPV